MRDALRSVTLVGAALAALVYNQFILEEDEE